MKRCPATTAFNPELMICDRPLNVPSCDGNSEIRLSNYGVGRSGHPIILAPNNRGTINIVHVNSSHHMSQLEINNFTTQISESESPSFYSVNQPDGFNVSVINIGGSGNIGSQGVNQGKVVTGGDVESTQLDETIATVEGDANEDTKQYIPWPMTNHVSGHPIIMAPNNKGTINIVHVNPHLNNSTTRVTGESQTIDPSNSNRSKAGLTFPLINIGGHGNIGSQGVVSDGTVAVGAADKVNGQATANFGGSGKIGSQGVNEGNINMG